MKKMRILSLLLAVILTVSVFGAALAQGNQPEANRIFQTSWEKDFFLGNGSNETFYLGNSPNSFYDETGASYRDFEFDCKGVVKAKTSASWITVSTYKQGFVMDVKKNKSAKTRSAKITFTGKNYKATVTFVQIGTHKITSALRNKNKVTLKFSFCSGSDLKTLRIYRYQLDPDSGDTTGSQEMITEEEIKAKSYTFTVEKGYRYYFYLYSGKSGIVRCNYYPYGYFDVDSLTGTAFPTYFTSWG